MQEIVMPSCARIGLPVNVSSSMVGNTAQVVHY